MLVGAPELLTGVPTSGAGPTSPLMRITLFGSLTAFEVIVTLLLIGPGRFVSYLTRIVPFAPGAIGSFGHSGTVHPQDPFAFEIINGSSPVFLKSNVQYGSPSYLIFP